MSAPQLTSVFSEKQQSANSLEDSLLRGRTYLSQSDELREIGSHQTNPRKARYVHSLWLSQETIMAQV